MKIAMSCLDSRHSRDYQFQTVSTYRSIAFQQILKDVNCVFINEYITLIAVECPFLSI